MDWRVLLPTEKCSVGQRDVPVQLQGVWVRPGADGIVVMAHPLGWLRRGACLCSHA